MDFLASYWWAFLLGTVLCYGLMFANQIGRMKRMMSLDTFTSDDGDFTKGFFKGVPLLFIYGIAGTASGLLFLVGVIVALIRYAQAS